MKAEMLKEMPLLTGDRVRLKGGRQWYDDAWLGPRNGIMLVRYLDDGPKARRIPSHAEVEVQQGFA